MKASVFSKRYSVWLTRSDLFGITESTSDKVWLEMADVHVSFALIERGLPILGRQGEEIGKSFGSLPVTRTFLFGTSLSNLNLSNILLELLNLSSIKFERSMTHKRQLNDTKSVKQFQRASSKLE